MAPQIKGRLCAQGALESILDMVRTRDTDALAKIELELKTHGLDPRLHFLQGSVLAALGRYAEAISSLRRAVEIEPNYAIAQFQLGLLEFTSGDAAAALTTWRPLQSLPADNALRFFASGLEHLARDEFQKAIALLRDGIARNLENAPLNADMQMVVDNIMQAIAAEAQPISAAHLLLRQYSSTSKH